jgi:hypothetical protein
MYTAGGRSWMTNKEVILAGAYLLESKMNLPKTR